MKHIYLDNGATTRVRPEVVAVISEHMRNTYGNPSSMHSFGRSAKATLEQSREKIADLIGAKPYEIFFTSGGTEADNLAIFGNLVFSNKSNKKKHIITSATEHHAVLDACEKTEKYGHEVTYLPVDTQGFIRPNNLQAAIKDNTALVSIMYVNNEIGTIQNIESLSKIAKERSIPFHTDAVQGFGKVKIDVNKMNIDLLSASSHKIYGPKGVGFLYLREGLELSPINYGGGQEKRIRPGTENLSAIVGFALAAELAHKEMDRETERLLKLRDKLINGILTTVPNVRLNGSLEKRVFNNINVSIEFIEGEALLLMLDANGIAVSSGSACTSGSTEPSHVLTAIGLRNEIANGSIRITLGRENKEEDIDYFLDILPKAVDKLRVMSPLYKRK